MKTDLTELQLQRYKRHLMLPDVGRDGQLKLLNSKVLVVGAGGLGSPVLLYLAAAGVGTLGIADADVVDLSNLQRQIIHRNASVGRKKTESAEQSIRDLNPDVECIVHDEFLTQQNAERIADQYDFVVDATDGFSAKLLINDVCVKLGKAFSHGAICEFGGQLFTYVPGAACYRCIFGDAPQHGEAREAAEYGLFGAIAGVVGTLQAAEAIKFLCGTGDLLTNTLLLIDIATMQFQRLDVQKSPSCVCAR